jgi:predicted metalloprotease with PDZ domain
MVQHACINEPKHWAKLDVMDMVITEIDNVPALGSGMEMVSGLVVKGIGWGGIADQAGVAAGDVISEVNGIHVRTLHDLALILEAHTGKDPFRFLFRRVGVWRYLALPGNAPRLAASLYRVKDESALCVSQKL